MNRTIALIAAGMLLVAAPASAQTAAPAACTRPSPPAPVNGATISLDEMKAYRNVVVSFVGDSDAYQACVIADLTAQRAAAKAAKTRFDESVAKAADAQIDGNQKDKEGVAGAYNTARKAYAAAHPS